MRAASRVALRVVKWVASMVALRAVQKDDEKVASMVATRVECWVE